MTEYAAKLILIAVLFIFLLEGCARRKAEAFWITTAEVKYDGKSYVGKEIWGVRVTGIYFLGQGEFNYHFVGRPIQIDLPGQTHLRILPNGMYVNTTTATAAALVNFAAGRAGEANNNNIVQVKGVSKHRGLTLKIPCTPQSQSTTLIETAHCLGLQVAHGEKPSTSDWRNVTYETIGDYTRSKFQSLSVYMTIDH